MKLVLILMIKNEEKILKRCLEAVANIVDCFCICDTGSTDNTVEVAKEFLKDKVGCISYEPWKNFGHNRTVSFLHAQTFLSKLGWVMNETYGLLLDADMMFVPGKIKQQNLTEIGYKIIQINGSLEYYNCRFVRMDYPWKCSGVTHEYWDGPCVNMEKDICYIDDRNDGGCKHDKFERDMKLLEDGLKEDPTNVRYMFYLGQTYKCMGKLKESISMYKNRIKAGGWYEEVWYSHYMIGENYYNMRNFIKFEEWMQRAFEYRKERTESIFKLARFYREVGQHYKSYYYIKLAENIPFPKNDCLFIESDVYKGLFDYEKSVVEYYIHPEKCLRTTINFMLKMENLMNCVSNLKFSVKPLNAKITKFKLPSPFGDMTPSAISLDCYPFANVRYVNYFPPMDGNYRTKDGSPIQTRNAYVNLETNEFIALAEQPVPYESYVKGIEDLRLYRTDKLYFTATSCREYIQNKVCIIHGEYDLDNKTYTNIQAIGSPINSDCEKNWVNVPGTDDFIYSWRPLRVGKIRNNKFYFNKEIQTPPLFQLFRGSASPIEVDNKWIVLVHFVEYCQPRNYYHCFVELQKDYKVLKVSLPFVFEKSGIEFCISGRKVDDSLEYYFSSWDSNPSKIQIKLSDIEWIVISEPSIKNNIIKIPSNITTYWDGALSKCLPGKEIETYVNESINKQNLNKNIEFSVTDGIVDSVEFDRLLNEFGKQPGKLSKFIKSKNIIAGLCTRNLNTTNIALLPFYDDSFKKGLINILSSYHSPKWEDKISTLFWRGGSSGYDKPFTIRMNVVKKLLGNKYSDVKLTKWGNWEDEHKVPENYFGDRCTLSKHLFFKYLLIVDGACIASNHQWVFGSGSVPVMVTHPGNNWWFKKYLVPMKHYVPVSYNLSDLEEKIEWLVQNDDKAKEIVNNALEFSKEVFSPEFQRKYIDDELNRVAKELN